MFTGAEMSSPDANGCDSIVHYLESANTTFHIRVGLWTEVIEQK